MQDTIDPIILDDSNVQDPTEWLTGVLGDENVPVFDGEDLLWGAVAEATGVGEPFYQTRAGGRKEGTDDSVVH